jgi:hypothetical protein
MGQPMAKHRIPFKNQKNSQDSTGYRNKYARNQSPLHKAIGEDIFHVKNP